MPGSYNVDQVYADIKDFVDGFNFTAHIEDKSLALDAAGVMADGIIARSIDEQKPAEGSWDELKAVYKAWKAEKYGVELIGVLTGQMLSLNSVLGELEITPELMTLIYGKNEPGSGHHEDTDNPDEVVTDRKKAEWFSERRPFFELDDTITDKVFERIEKLLEEYLRKGST
jgi:hypothetical protein